MAGTWQLLVIWHVQVRCSAKGRMREVSTKCPVKKNFYFTETQQQKGKSVSKKYQGAYQGEKGGRYVHICVCVW